MGFELKDRSWLVRIGDTRTGEAIEFRDLHIEFTVKKSLYPEPNSVSLTVYGLNAEHRRQIEAINTYDPKKVKGAKAAATVGDTVQKRPTAVSRAPKTGNIYVEIVAGYKKAKSLIFRGDLRRAITKREGPEVKLEIEGEDGGRSVLSSRVTHSFPPGTQAFEVVQECAKAMGVGLGNIREVRAKLRKEYSHGTTLSGSAADQLKGILRRHNISYSIQNGVLHFRDPSLGQTVAGLLISPETGLVGYPERDATGALMVTTLLIPDVAPGQYIQLQSKEYSGAYYIKAVESKGQSAGNDWYHELECWPA